MRPRKQGAIVSAGIGATLAALAAVPASDVTAQTARNPNCPTEEVFYDPGNGEDIIVPRGYKVEVFARDLNFPTGIAFRGDRNNFQVFVLESGTGLPGRCNDNRPAGV